MEMDQIAGFLRPKTDKPTLALLEKSGAIEAGAPELEGFSEVLGSAEQTILKEPQPLANAGLPLAPKALQQSIIDPVIFAATEPNIAPSEDIIPAVKAENITPEKTETTVLVTSAQPQASLNEAETPVLASPTMAPAKPTIAESAIPLATLQGKPQIIAAETNVLTANLPPIPPEPAMQKRQLPDGKSEIAPPKLEAAPIPKPPEIPPAQAAIISMFKAEAEALPPEPELQPIQSRQPETSSKAAIIQAAPPPTMAAAAPLAPINSGEWLVAEANADAELPINIRIERQALESQALTQQSSRTTTPVAAQIASQIQSQITKNTQQVIELRLDPPELGRVVIQLSTNDQVVIAQVSAERPETIDLMRRHAELLAATLEKAGFSQANLSFQQGTAQQNQRDFDDFENLSLTNEPTDATSLATPLPVIDGRLDIRL